MGFFSRLFGGGGGSSAPAAPVEPTATPTSLGSVQTSSFSGVGLRAPSVGNPAAAGGGGPSSVAALIQTALDPQLSAGEPESSLQTGTVPSNPNYAALDYRMQPTYEVGGQVGPGGTPIRPPGVNTGEQGPIPAPVMQQEIQRMVKDHPEQVVQIKNAMMQAVQAGDLTPQELNTMKQLALSAAQNPQLYPQIRNFAIQQGLAQENELPAEYDQGLVFIILLATQSVEAQVGGGGAPQAQGQTPVGAFEAGGALPTESKNEDGSVPIVAHEGEYVIPAEVVRRKGTDFFDKMVSSVNEQKTT